MADQKQMAPAAPFGAARDLDGVIYTFLGGPKKLFLTHPTIISCSLRKEGGTHDNAQMLTGIDLADLIGLAGVDTMCRAGSCAVNQGSNYS